MRFQMTFAGDSLADVVANVTDWLRATSAKAPTPAEEPPAPTPEKKPAKKAATPVVEAPPVITAEDLVAAVRAYSDKHGTLAVHKVFQNFGVGRITEVKREQYSEFLAALAL